MQKQYITLVVLALLFISCSGQTEWYHYHWEKDGVPDKQAYYEKTYQANFTKYAGSKFLRGFDKRFISYCSVGLYQNIQCGKIYKSFSGYEDYIRKVLEAVVGDKKLCNNIDIKFVRDEEFNATMSENGMLEINVGLIPLLANESELALILAHEMGHYLNDDVAKNYGKLMDLTYNREVPGIFGLITNIVGTNNYYSFNRENESAADLESMRFISASSYSARSCLGAFQTMQYLQIQDQLEEGRIRKYWRTHPYATERLDYLESLSDSRINHGNRNYIVDSTAFQQLKRVCRQEVANISFIDGKLDQLIKNTFSHYLLEPMDAENLAVLVEAIRRKLNYSAAENIANKQFILQQYLTPLIYKQPDYIFLANPNLSILQCLNKNLINIPPENISAIKAIELTDTTIIEFKTYMEAYVYFKEKAESAGIKESRHYQFFGQMPDFSNAEDYIRSNDIFLTNDFIRTRGLITLRDSNLYVLIPNWSTFSNLPAHSFNLEEYEKLNADFKDAVSKEMSKKEILLSTDLRIDHQHMFYTLANHTHLVFKKGPRNLETLNANMNWLMFYPEIFNLFNDRGIKNIYACRLNKRDPKKMEVELYKISLPGSGKTTFLIKRIDKRIRYVNDYYVNFKDIGREFSSFVKSTKN